MRYGTTLAVDGLSFEAHRGQVLAILGPNGAGKTSTVEALEGYRKPESGTLRILGLDPQRHHAELRARIGVMLQRAGVYPVMSARQVLRLFASYYRDPEDPEDLLALLGLSEVARTPWKRLSGGEQQRLSLALALVGRPEVVFLDEPTAGVDPEGRIAIRSVLQGLRERSVAVVLTTHELAEAEKVADQVIIMAQGTARARGTVDELRRSFARALIQFRTAIQIDESALAAALGIPAGGVARTPGGDYEVLLPPSADLVSRLAAWLQEHGVELTSLSTGEGTLEDLYMEVLAGVGQSGSSAVAAAEPATK